MQRIRTGLTLALVTLAAGFLAAACEEAPQGGGTQGGATPTPNATAAPVASGGDGGLKIGSLLPATGDLASIGSQMIDAVPFLVETVNACGGVNSKPVTLVAVDDQTDPKAGAAGMTKLATLDKVAGVVGSFASSVSTAAVTIGAQNKVMLISPGSTSPVFTQRAKEYGGFWSRTAPPDTYQAAALAQLAKKKGYKKVSTVVINNDYGVGFEQAFITAFEKLGGTVVNKDKPVRYDPKAQTFETEAQAVFAGKPDAVLGVFYEETGALFLKSAYQQGLSKGVQILLTDGVKSDTFPERVGKTDDGKFIVAGNIGTVPGSKGQGLEAFQKLWQSKKGAPPAPYTAHAWDAAALLTLAAQSAKENTGTGIASKIREVANAPGEEVSDVCQALKLLQEGKDINFQGASGNVDIDENGDVVGVYDVWQVGDDGKLKTIDQVTP